MQAWKQMKHDTETAINARLGSIVKKLEEGMSRGVHMYYSDEIGHPAKRMSDNDAWYGEFYKQHKRKPNERELLDMAREIYGGGGAKYGTAGIGYENLPDEAQADIDALDRDFETLNVLEDIKGKVSQLTASEMTVTKGLSPSGYRVYQSVRGQLAQGNKDVQDSARVNAILFARYADRMADNITKITGKEYTAEDYVRERIMLVPNATQVDERGLEQRIPVDTFYTVEVTGNEFGEYKDLSDLRKKAVKWYKDNLQGTIARNFALGEIILDKSVMDQGILFNSDGRNKMKNTSAKAEKLLLVKHLKNIIENANFITESESTSEKHKGEYFYYLHAAVTVGEEKQYVIVTVRKTLEGRLCYRNHNVYTPNGYKKLEDSLHEALGSRLSNPSQYPQEVSSTDFSIPEDDEIFNQQRVFYQTDGHFGRGYHGWSKSNNAVSAEDEGRFPATVAAKKLGVKAGAIKLYIPTGEWHHTSNHYNKTYYYDIADLLLYKEGGRDALAEEGYDETEIDRIENLYNDMKAYKEPKADEQVYRADITYVEWGGTRKHPKADEQKYENVIVRQKGSFYTFTLPNGTKVRKKIGSNGTKVKRIPDLEEAQASAETLDKVGERTRRFLEDNHKGYEVSWSGTVYPQGKKPTSKEYDDPKAFFTKGDMILRNENGKAVLQEWTGDKWETVEESTGVNPQSLMYAMSQVALYEARNGVSLRGETYNQSVRGQTRISGASRMVSLFEQADKSTFVHEMGHVALADLKLLAEMEGAPAELVRDWQTVKEWLGYKDSQGFTREQHEKFARGFEAYYLFSSLSFFLPKNKKLS